MTGIELIAAERRRQIEEEGFDKGHDMGQGYALTRAGAAYAAYAAGFAEVAAKLWPWAMRWWKPSDSQRLLVKAGALLAAAIDAAAPRTDMPDVPGALGIEGRDLTSAFWAGTGGVKRYRKTANVLAAQMTMSGVVSTPEGEMAFVAGDYLVTDDMVTHAWPVRGAVFEATYRVMDPDPLGHGTP